MNVVIYARFSSHSQTEQSIEGQLKVCYEYAESHNYTVVGEYIDQPKYTKACEILDNGFEDAFQYTVLSNSHNRLKSTNLLEHLNQEVRRREKIIRIFPNHASANRLIGAVLMDLHDEWLSSTRKYIKFGK